MLSEGEPDAGGGGICWEDARRDNAASACGEGGTELRSGIARPWLDGDVGGGGKHVVQWESSCFVLSVYL